MRATLFFPLMILVLGWTGCAIHGGPEASAKASQEYQACMARGSELLAGSQYREAAQEFQQAIRWNPKSVPAHNLAGLSYLRLQQPAQAQGPLERACALDPVDPAVLCNLGALSVMNHRYPEARDYLERATRANPDFAVAHYSLASVLIFLGDGEGAKQAFLRAFQLDPGLASLSLKSSVGIPRTGAWSMEACLSIARVFAGVGNADETALYLQRARDLGFHDWPKLLAEAAFERVRDAPQLKPFAKD